MEREFQSVRTAEEIVERVDENQKEREEKQEITNDENASPFKRAAAGKRVAEIDEEQARTRTNVVERTNMALLNAIILVAGLVIGAVSLADTNALKATAKALGNGLKEVGKKSLPYSSAWSARSFLSSSKLQERSSAFWRSTPGC